jgi:MraZ protein
MALFNGTFVQNFDAKGRVSVPALFRAALRAGASTPTSQSDGPVSIPLVLRPSEKAQCIEALTETRHQALVAELEKLDPLSEEYDQLATVLFADAYPIETDKEGRIIVNDALLGFAGISRAGSVAFVGMGTRFQLWHPDKVSDHKLSAQAAYRERVVRQREAARDA